METLDPKENSYPESSAASNIKNKKLSTKSLPDLNNDISKKDEPKPETKNTSQKDKAKVQTELETLNQTKNSHPES